MKLFIGLALLSAAFAAQPAILPEAVKPAYEKIESSQARDSQVMVANLNTFQTPDIGHVFIDPALASKLNDQGEFQEELLNVQYDGVPGDAVLFVDHADELSPVKEPVNQVSPVQVADLFMEAEEAGGDKTPVKFLDTPMEVESDSADSVVVVDIPVEEDSKVEDVDAVLIADTPLVDVDPVLVVDGPVEQDASPAEVPAPSAIDLFIAKLLANRRDDFYAMMR